jgi:hypothetical protein
MAKAKKGSETPQAPVPSMSEQQIREQQQQALQAALVSPLPRFYANSFGIVQTSSDVTIVLMQNNQPLATVAMSFISMKSLVSDLTVTINNIEKATNQKIKTIAEITQDLQKVMGKPLTGPSSAQ